MRVHYISPSTLPSRQANAVHVVMQCEALSEKGNEVILYARRSTPDTLNLQDLICNYYGVRFHNCKLHTIYSRSDRATSLRIALMALLGVFKCWKKTDTIVSRNLYASFLLGAAFRYPLLYETHELESGWRKFLQHQIMIKPQVTTIVITQRLLEILQENHGGAPAKAFVLHDAASEGPPPLPLKKKRQEMLSRFPDIHDHWTSVCGYFGHLYSGRGIEIIMGMSAARPEILFLVFGGNESDVSRYTASNSRTNLRFMGHLAHAQARDVMRCMDVLLMPYQTNVSIGIKGHDIGQCLSPMKMFEYMASGVPIISSDLPVLKEVLRNNENALLVQPSDSKQWVSALDMLLQNKSKAQEIAQKAYADFKAKHTWSLRAARIMEIAQRHNA